SVPSYLWLIITQFDSVWFTSASGLPHNRRLLSGLSASATDHVSAAPMASATMAPAHLAATTTSMAFAFPHASVKSVSTLIALPHTSLLALLFVLALLHRSEDSDAWVLRPPHRKACSGF